MSDTAAPIEDGFLDHRSRLGPYRDLALELQLARTAFFLESSPVRYRAFPRRWASELMLKVA